MANNTNTMYEKVVNIRFYQNYSDPPEKVAQQIITPSYGYKPKIEISASILPNSIYSNIELRVTNAEVDFNAVTFQKVSIDAGYYNSTTINNLTGRITQAYVETPGPDGVTVFIILLGQEEMTNTLFYDNRKKGDNENLFECSKGTTVGACLTKLLGSMSNQGLQSYQLQISSTYSNKVLQVGYTGYGSYATILQDLINVKFGLSFSFKNNTINVFDNKYGSSTAVTEIDRFSSTPSVRVAGHVNFSAPWIPGLVPGDYIKINPQFMKMTFGGYNTLNGAGVAFPDIYNIIKIDFDFSTVESTNIMIVDAIASTQDNISTFGG